MVTPAWPIVALRDKLWDPVVFCFWQLAAQVRRRVDGADPSQDVDGGDAGTHDDFRGRHWSRLNAVLGCSGAGHPNARTRSLLPTYLGR